MSYVGIAVAAVGFLYATFLIFNRLFFLRPITGWTSIMVVLLVVGGLQMVMIGVIGEYLWRTLDEARARPHYTILDLLNISSPNEEGKSARSTQDILVGHP
jgi:polyisoprenyl-phosphate glycosyltransferase